MKGLQQAILECADYSGLSDIHIHSDCPVYLRVNGQMRIFSRNAVAADELWAFTEHYLTSELKRLWLNKKSIDLSIECGNCRYRANFYFESKQPAVVLRKIAKIAPQLQDLGVPSSVNRALATSHGLILLTGATGSGKSTSLAAMVNHILSTRAIHLLTIEDPIEFFFHSQRSLVSQREVGIDVLCFASALRAAFREDPDVILIGEMRDLETISLALTAAETGHLVLATLHTANCVGTVNRIVDAFPAGSRDQARTQLADSLQMVVGQRLLNRVDRSGRVAAFEVLLASDAVRNLIRSNKTHQLQSVMDTSHAQGMVSMRVALESLQSSGVIDDGYIICEDASKQCGIQT